MIKVRSCRRCRGDLFLEADASGSHWTCLQCGYLTYQEVPRPRPLAGLMARDVSRVGSQEAAAGPAALVMGDDADSCLSLAAHLMVLGLRPVVAQSWEAAWRHLETDRYRLVFIDAEGTHISALASAKRIKRLWPSTRVVVLVDWGSDDEEVLLQSADFVAHKPLTWAELRQIVGARFRQGASAVAKTA
ncbi:MAG: hypothetical protein ACE5IZ_11025 [Dehalococcoidia bacterium]